VSPGALTGLLLIGLVHLSTRPLPAQATLDSALTRLSPGKHVRLRAEGGPRLEGRFLGSTTGSTVQLGVGGGTREVAGIDSLWVRGNAIGLGALVGAVAVGIPWTVLIVMVCGTDDDGCETGAVVGAAAIGSGAGALLGVGVGALIHKWKLRYARAGTGINVVVQPSGQVGIGLSMPFPPGSR